MASKILGVGLVGFALVANAVAQNSTATSSAAPAVHTVTVGKFNNQFQPDMVVARPGDIVSFQFYPANHSVARAAYGHPCIPYEDTGNDLVGFFSKFQPINSVLSDASLMPTWNLTINDTNPVFFYCTAPGSCINFGMVGVINPNVTQSITTQQSLAKSSDYMLQPGEPIPPESSATSAPVVPVPSHKVLSTGAIVGIVIGGVAVLLLGGALFYLIGRTRTLKQVVDNNNNNNNNSHQKPTPPEAFQSGGASFIPVAPGDYRYSTLPPYQQKQNEIDIDVRDMGMRSPSPGSPYMGVGQPFQGFVPVEAMKQQQGQQMRYVLAGGTSDATC
ncbi:hypothetical protein LTR50_006336 [Elasticomyces elasticus]|nr:hypothetical protein LTR50_006336 [Elasticomyces elasticus]